MAAKRNAYMRIGEAWTAGILNRTVDDVPSVQVVCGYRSCAAGIAFVDSITSQHVVGHLGMLTFIESPDEPTPVVALGKRYAWQWRLARQQGMRWSQFSAQARRTPRSSRTGLRLGNRDLKMWSGNLPLSFRFECPACGRWNRADVPDECTSSCPYHCPSCGEERRADRPHQCRERPIITLRSGGGL